MQAIIFDMDGVLVDSEPVHFEATRLLMQEHGIVYTSADEEAFFGCTDREMFRELRARYGLAAHEHELAEQWIERVVRLLPQRIVPMPGVPEVLERLRASGRRLALASSSSPAIIRTTIEGLGLGGIFEATVSGRDVGLGKPAPDIFLETARRMGLEPAELSRRGGLAERPPRVGCRRDRVRGHPVRVDRASGLSRRGGPPGELARPPGLGGRQAVIPTTIERGGER